MRGCAVFERVHQEAELLLGFFGSEAEYLEHLALQCAVVDTYRAATHFYSVDHHIVGIGTHRRRVSVKQRNVFVLRVGERMVHRHKALLLIAPFKHREVNYPQAGKFVLVAQTELIAHLQTQLAQLFASLHRVVARQYQYQVARLGAEGSLHLLEHILSVEFIDRRLHIAVSLHTGIYHTFGSYLRTFHIFGERVELFAGIICSPLSTDTAYISRVVKHSEAVAFHYIHQLHELHVETQVGLVRAVIFHGIGPRHAHERLRKLHASYLFEQVLGHTLEQVDDVILLHIAHLAVYLRELGLAVGTQILVAETFHNLEIAVHARHHKQLLERLRTLRQRIELSRIHT